MFEKASRLKVRFSSQRGGLTVEDLWDLPLTSKTGRVNLDDIARDLHKQLKEDDNISFVVSTVKKDEVTQLKFDIVKRIISVKLEEAKMQAAARETAEKKQRIMQLISEKQDEALSQKSLEELQSMVNDLR